MAENECDKGTSSKSDIDMYHERILLEPYQYIQQNPGKEVRVKLTQAFNYWMKIPNDKLEIVSEVTQMLHNASLLIDDIEDNSKLRRGNPVAHSIYGIPQTINTANYVYFLALQKIMALEIPEATKIYMVSCIPFYRTTLNLTSRTRYGHLVERQLYLSNRGRI